MDYSFFVGIHKMTHDELLTLQKYVAILFVSLVVLRVVSCCWTRQLTDHWEGESWKKAVRSTFTTAAWLLGMSVSRLWTPATLGTGARLVV
jgi:cytochrome c biogenesis protein CcdA